MDQPSNVERDAMPARPGRSSGGMASACVCGALVALPALTEAAVSIGSCATGDTGDFRWLTPAVRWLARLP